MDLFCHSISHCTQTHPTVALFSKTIHPGTVTDKRFVPVVPIPWEKVFLLMRVFLVLLTHDDELPCFELWRDAELTLGTAKIGIEMASGCLPPPEGRRRCKV